MTYDIGELIYIGNPSNGGLSLYVIILIVVIILVIIGIVVLLYLMKKRQIGCFTKDVDYEAQYRAGHEVQFQGLDSAGQRMFDMQNRENSRESFNIL